jgi:hypothetical protein
MGFSAVLVAIVIGLATAAAERVLGGLPAPAAGVTYGIAEGVLLVVMATAALGMDSFPDSDVRRELDAPLWLVVFSLPLLLLTMATQGGGTGSRLGVVLRPQLLVLSLMVLAPAAFFQAAAPTTGATVVGALAATVYSLLTVASLRPDGDAWGTAPISRAWEREPGVLLLTVGASCLAGAAASTLGAALLGGMLAWCLGAIAITCLSVGLLSTLLDDDTEHHPATEHAPVGSDRGAAGQAASPDVVAAPPAGVLDGRVDTVIACGQRWGEWITCETSGQIVIELSWSDGEPASLQAATDQGLWYELTPLERPGTVAITVHPGAVWLQVDCPPMLEQRHLQMAWHLEAQGAGHDTAA